MEKALEPEMLRLQTYCLQRDWYVSASFCDANCSWTKDFCKREQGKQLLQQLQPGDTIVSNSLDRIFSSSDDAVQLISLLKEKDVCLHIVELAGDVTDPDFSVNLEAIARLFSALEKRKSTERIKGVKQKQRKQGRYLGGSRPFGYMIHENGRLIENPMEQRVLRRIFDLKKQGKSLRAISSEVSTPIAPISFKTVQRLLQRHADSL